MEKLYWILVKYTTVCSYMLGCKQIECQKFKIKLMYQHTTVTEFCFCQMPQINQKTKVLPLKLNFCPSRAILKVLKKYLLQYKNFFKLFFPDPKSISKVELAIISVTATTGKKKLLLNPLLDTVAEFHLELLNLNKGNLAFYPLDSICIKNFMAWILWLKKVWHEQCLFF